MEDSFSFGSQSCFHSPVWLWGVHACNVIGIVKTTPPPTPSPQITNYVMGCILLKGSFFGERVGSPRCIAIPAIQRSILVRQGHSATVLPLHRSVFLLVSVSLLFFLSPSSHSSPLSLLLFSFGWMSLALPSSLRRSLCGDTPSLSHLRPPALSPLFSSAPPPQPHLHPLCIKHVITECS